jgi:hypothetical protein
MESTSFLSGGAGPGSFNTFNAGYGTAKAYEKLDPTAILGSTVFKSLSDKNYEKRKLGKTISKSNSKI